MSPSELRYFRMYARMQQSEGKWNYLQLFDAILEQSSYDEAALKTQFAGSKIARNMAIEKHYLYLQVLKALRQYRSRKRKDLQLREMLEGVEILVEKGLSEAAWRLLKRVRKQAEKLELSLIQVEAHILQRRLGKQLGGGKKLKPTTLPEEGEALMEAITDELHYHQLYDRFSELIRERHDLKGGNRNERLSELLEDPIMQKPQAPATLHARTLWHQMKGNAAYLRQDYPEALSEYRSTVEDWRQFPHAIRRDPNRFFRALTNYMTGLQQMAQYAAIPEQLRELRRWKRDLGIPPSPRDVQEYHFELLYFLNTGDFKGAQKAAQATAQFITSFGPELNHNWNLTLAYNLSVVFLLNSAFSEALTWTNYIIDLSAGKKRQQAQQMARIFQLVIHYELHNLDLLEYLLRNSSDYLRKKGAMDRFEAEVLKTIRKLIRLAPNEDPQTLFQALETFLSTAFPQPFAGLNEVKYWAKARANRENIWEVASRAIKQGPG